MASAPTLSAVADEQEVSITLEDILHVLRRRWYLILFCALLGGALACFAASVQSAVYARKASIILKDEKGARDLAASNPIMAELGLGSNTANIANEVHVLQSSPVMRRVVEQLGLNISYWMQDGLRKTELYKETPLRLSVSDMDLTHPWYTDEGDTRPWYVKIINKRDRRFAVTPGEEGKYTLDYKDEAGEPVRCEGVFGEALKLPFATLTLEPTLHMTAEWQGVSVFVIHGEVEKVTRELIKENLSVQRPDVKEGSLLELSFKANHPLKAQEALDALLDIYNQMSVEEKRETARNTKVFLDVRLSELDAELTRSEHQLTEYRQQNNFALEEQSSVGPDFHTTKELEKQIFSIETQLKLAATLADEVKSTRAEGRLIAVDAEMLKDSALSQQIQSYNGAFLEYRKLVSSAGDKNPLIVNQRERMFSILSAIDKALVNYRSNIGIRLQELNEQLASIQSRVSEGFVKRQEIAPLMRQHKVLEELYLLLLSKEQENALSIAIAEPRSRILEQAYGERRPVAPRRLLYTAGGLVGGSGLCFLVLLVINMLDTKVKDKQGLEGVSSLPVVAELPRLTWREKKEGLFVKGAHSAMAEGLHILRNNVENLIPRRAEGAPIILLTSTIPGEGKTTTAANIAAAYAQTGQRVLVIDGDLRKGSLTSALAGKGHLGLSSLLLQKVAGAGELILRQSAGSGEASFDLLPSGPLPPNPVTLLSQPLLEQLMEELRGHYDVILLDAPPYTVVADTDILARQADVSLYLVRSGMIDRRYFAQVQRMADDGHLPNAVYVLNDVNFRDSKSQRYGYGNYRYGGQNEQKA